MFVVRNGYESRLTVTFGVSMIFSLRVPICITIVSAKVFLETGNHILTIAEAEPLNMT